MCCIQQMVEAQADSAAQDTMLGGFQEENFCSKGQQLSTVHSLAGNPEWASKTKITFPQLCAG